jgi:hypothetical protein
LEFTPRDLIFGKTYKCEAFTIKGDSSTAKILKLKRNLA